MKPLQRIEAALDQLNIQKTGAKIEKGADDSPHLSHVSFDIRSAADPADAPPIDAIAYDVHVHEPTATSAHSTNTPPDISPDLDGSMPLLPKLKTDELDSLPEPDIALRRLNEIEAVISGWYAERQRVIQRIQTIQREGPVLNGWLESQTPTSPLPGAAALRHAEVDQLMTYIEELCEAQTRADQSLKAPMPKSTYRLCSRDADGRVWSRPCTPEQLPEVSLAIARYQTLHQLLERQTFLEKRLGAIAAALGTLKLQLCH